MRGIVTILFIQFFLSTHAQNKLGAIGQWRGHYDNHSIIKVLKGGDNIFAASPYQIMSINNQLQNYWIDKTNGLNDINIRHLAWDNSQQQLVIGYANSNIDILKEDQVFNVNAIQLTKLFTDKKINAITIYKNWGLIATNFGIVVIDLVSHEIKNNWFPNTLQEPIATWDLLVANDTIYAATANGLWVSKINANTFSNTSWNRLSAFDNAVVKKLVSSRGNIYAYNSQAVFQLPNSVNIFNYPNATIQHIDTSTTALLLSIQYSTNKGAILALNKDNSTTLLIDSTQLAAPQSSLVDNNNYWVADSTKGLLLKNNNFQWLSLGGTNGRIQGIASISENALLAPYGNLKMGFVKWNQEKWETYPIWGNIKIPNVNASIINNKENSYWLTSDNAILHLTNDNKMVSVQPNDLTGAYKQIQIDYNDRIWAIQDQQGLVQQINSSWNTILAPTTFSKNGLHQFIVNEQGQAWLIAPNQQGLYVYQNKSVYNNELWRQLTTAPNNGNLPSTNVSSIVKDKTGSIWVGTDNGIGIFNCGDISEPCNAYLPIVNNNGFNGYLFQKETVKCIQIDGANRKWLGTNNGAWLLSADGTQIIEHFTSLNSPLPNDTVVQILIEPNTGEVFMNTLNQMVSYRGTATEGKKTQTNIQIFPNPVSSNFNGQIAMRGLVENALVKITDINGKLLYQTIALGGQALWNGKNLEGLKVATGIYLVFVRDLNGNEQSVGKILIADGY